MSEHVVIALIVFMILCNVPLPPPPPPILEGVKFPGSNRVNLTHNRCHFYGSFRDVIQLSICGYKAGSKQIQCDLFRNLLLCFQVQSEKTCRPMCYCDYYVNHKIVMNIIIIIMCIKQYRIFVCQYLYLTFRLTSHDALWNSSMDWACTWMT